VRQSLSSAFAIRRRESAERRDPASEIGSLVVTDNPIGAVLSIGMFIIVWGALPVVRPFLIAAIGLGVTYSAVLWVRRR
jgi:hypothetical protein